MTIDLSKLPAPEMIEGLDYETLLSLVSGVFIAQFAENEVDAAEKGIPSQSDVENQLAVEGSVSKKLLETYAKHMLLFSERANENNKQTLLTFATGSNLDQRGLDYGVLRLDGENDDDFRARILLAIDGFSTAGPRKAYEFHAISANSNVKNVFIDSPDPGDVRVTVLSKIGNGTPDEQMLNDVYAALDDENVRPLSDTIIMNAANVSDYTIQAEIYLYPGPDQSLILQSAIDAANKYASDTHRLGYDVRMSGIYAALHQNGVQRVEITSPASDIVNGDLEASFCTSVTVTIGGEDE